MTELIVDGILIKPNLAQRNKSSQWLTEQLKKQNLTIQDIAFAAILPNDKLYIDLYKDQLPEKSEPEEDNKEGRK